MARPKRVETPPAASGVNTDVLQVNQHGDPVRGEDGQFKRKAGWESSAKDRLGRAYNPRLHGPTPELDEGGWLRVVRRDAARAPMGAQTALYDLVQKADRENPGYVHRFVNMDPGRMERFQAHDYEPVSSADGAVTMAVGAGKTARLMRKPKEWYDEDQQAKVKAANAHIRRISRPDPAKGQYGEGLSSDPQSRLA